MTQDETTRILFERVLESLTRAEGDAMALMGTLSQLDGEIRALAVIRALLSADVALKATFADVEPTQRERELARRAALALAEAADRLEAETPGRNPVRLREMALRCAAF
jgi:hypothetical protein